MDGRPRRLADPRVVLQGARRRRLGRPGDPGDVGEDDPSFRGSTHPARSSRRATAARPSSVRPWAASPDGRARAPTDRCPSAFAMHPVACAIGCADASIPTREGQRASLREGSAVWQADERTAGTRDDAPRATPLATPVDLRRHRNASDRELGCAAPPGLSPTRSDALPAGRPGLSRAAVPVRPRRDRRGAGCCSSSEVVVDLRSAGPASHVVVAHFCDAWRDPVGGTSGGPADRLGHARSASRSPGTRSSWPRARTVGRGRAPAVRGERGHRRLGPGRLRRRPASGRHAARLARPVSGDAAGRLRRARATPGCSGSCPGAGVRPRPAWPIRCRARPATSRCGCTRSRSRTARSSSRRLRHGAARAARCRRRGRRRGRDGLPRDRLAAGRSSRDGRCGSTARRRCGPIDVDLGQVFRDAPGAVARVKAGDTAGHDAITGLGDPLATDDGRPDARLVDLAMARRRDDRRRIGGSVPAEPPAGRRRARTVRRPSRSSPCRRRRGGSTSRSSMRHAVEPMPARVRFLAAGRAIPPAARTPRRDQPRAQRGHRGGPRPRRRDLRLRPGPVPDRAAGRRRRGRGGPRVRLSTAPPIGRRRRRRRRDRWSCRWSRSTGRSGAGLDRGRLPRPLHLADVGAAPGAGRGRRHREPARDAVGRPPHEHRRPPGRSSSPTRPASTWS